MIIGITTLFLNMAKMKKITG